jgi:aminopeptidase N
LASAVLVAQRDFYAFHQFERADTLRGSMRPERTCFDVTFYGLHLDLAVERRQLSGYVDIDYRVVEPTRRLQLDLYENLRIDAVESQGKRLAYEREGNAFFVDLPARQLPGEQHRLTVHYHGSPQAAENPPWDGGFVWSQDERERPWVGVACEGVGASLWWPNKDHLSDEPDSVLISVTVPKELTVVANGNLRETEEMEERTRYDWFVSYPINNYNVTLNAGHYAHWNREYYSRLDGDTLALDFYVLDYHLATAQKHFAQVDTLLAAFEHYLGKYPFWEDGYALIEAPYLGMEHQSGIAYGNYFSRGYLGGMIPRGMDFDYIIVHETGHEYFGNSIGATDLAEMWIHESFTTYLEALYVEFVYGYPEAIRYLVSQRPMIYNQEPILGPAGVNWHDWAGSDHYFKGSWVLHTLRHAIGDDELWFGLLRDFYRQHAYQTITTQQFIDHVNAATGTDWTAFFEHYLWYPQLPVLELELVARGRDTEVRYRWNSPVAELAMPVLLGPEDDRRRVTPRVGSWQSERFARTRPEAIQVAEDLFLIEVNVLPQDR